MAANTLWILDCGFKSHRHTEQLNEICFYNLTNISLNKYENCSREKDLFATWNKCYLRTGGFISGSFVLRGNSRCVVLFRSCDFSVGRAIHLSAQVHFQTVTSRMSALERNWVCPFRLCCLGWRSYWKWLSVSHITHSADNLIWALLFGGLLLKISRPDTSDYSPICLSIWLQNTPGHQRA